MAVTEQALLLPVFAEASAEAPAHFVERASWRSTFVRIGAAVLAVGAVVGVAAATRNATTARSVDLAADDSNANMYIEITPTNADSDAGGLLKTTDSYPFLKTGRLVEPMRDSTMEINIRNVPKTASKAKCTWIISPTSDAGVYRNIKYAELHETPNGEVELDSSTGSFVYKFVNPGSYRLTLSCDVEHAGELETSTVEFSDEIQCFYVRRELREMSNDMRENFLDAFTVTMNTPTSEGVMKYGPNYRSLEDFEIMHVQGAGARDVDHLHDGLGLISQHVAMTNDFELALQSVNPTIAMPYWDYTIDSYHVWETARTEGIPAAEYGEIFKKSELFTEKWFGTTDEASHRISTGRFKDQEVPRDFDFETRSPYGFLRAPWNLNPSKYVTRYHTFCGEKPSSQFFVATDWDADNGANKLFWPTCEVHHAWTNTPVYDSWYEYAMNIGYAPHGPVHVWMGGIGGGQCEDGTWGEMEKEGIINHRQLMLIKHMAFIFLKNAWKAELIEMPKYCAADTPVGECKWVCVEDFAENPAAEKLAQIFFNIDKSHDHYEEVITRIACETPFWPGDHLEAASPVEASFWPIHPTIDRMTQYKQVVRPFTDRSWDTGPVCNYPGKAGNCLGHNAYDVTFFESTVLNITTNSYEKRHLTNQQVRESTNPISHTSKATMTEDWQYAAVQPGYAMPYVYNHFEWHHCGEMGIHFEKVPTTPGR